VCQDNNLVLVSDGSVTGQTTHFTPFALINYPGGGDKIVGTGSSSSSKSKKTGIYVGVFVTLGVLIVAAAVTLLVIRRRNPALFSRMFSSRFNRMMDDSRGVDMANMK